MYTRPTPRTHEEDVPVVERVVALIPEVAAQRRRHIVPEPVVPGVDNGVNQTWWIHHKSIRHNRSRLHPPSKHKTHPLAAPQHGRPPEDAIDVRLAPAPAFKVQEEFCLPAPEAGAVVVGCVGAVGCDIMSANKGTVRGFEKNSIQCSSIIIVDHTHKTRPAQARTRRGAVEADGPLADRLLGEQAEGHLPCVLPWVAVGAPESRGVCGPRREEGKEEEKDDGKKAKGWSWSWSCSEWWLRGRRRHACFLCWGGMWMGVVMVGS